MFDKGHKLHHYIRSKEGVSIDSEPTMVVEFPEVVEERIRQEEEAKRQAEESRIAQEKAKAAEVASQAVADAARARRDLGAAQGARQDEAYWQGLDVPRMPGGGQGRPYGSGVPDGTPGGALGRQAGRPAGGGLPMPGRPPGYKPFGGGH